MTDIRVPTDHKAEFFAEHDVWFAPDAERVLLFANEKGRNAINQKFDGSDARWNALPTVPADWQATSLADNPRGMVNLIEWCITHDCTVAFAAGDKTITFQPGADISKLKQMMLARLD